MAQTIIRPQATKRTVIRSTNNVLVIASAKQGPAGPTGTGDKHYAHDQMTPSASWTVTHNLGKFPAIMIVDSSGNVVEGNIQHVDTTQAILTFTSAFSGMAYCN